MRVLVTGGLGFTGQAVARHLIAAGHDVAVMTSADMIRSAVPPGADLIRADLRDRSAVERAIAGREFDGVCHLAARTRVRDSFADPVGYFDVNVTGTANLLAALEDESERTGTPPRLVFASTGAVYGSREGTLNEDEPTHPTNPYGSSKLAAEQLLGYQAAAGRIAAVTLRCFNIAGAVPTGASALTDSDLTRIIPKTLAVAAGTADRLQINGDGSAVREYTHVLDVAAAFALALNAATVGEHQVLNVGSGHGATLAEVLAVARRITGRPISAEHLPPKPEAKVLMADSRRIRTRFGWQPSHSSLEQILRDGWAALAAAAA